MSQNVCNHCRWFDAKGSFGMGPNEGLCRFNAPLPISHGKLTEFAPDDDLNQQEELLARSSYWPVVSIDDWCGQFKDK